LEKFGHLSLDLPLTGGSLSGTLSISNTTNRLVLGATNTTTINAPTPTASMVCSFPIQPTTAEFAMISTTGSSHIVQTFETVSATSSNILSAVNMAASIVTAGGGGTLTMTNSALMAANDSLAPFNVVGSVFKVLVCNTSGPNKTLASAVGCTISGRTTLSAGDSRVLHFVNMGAATWNVY
jgi:hypothetical protein